jgi:hypothetical protein
LQADSAAAAASIAAASVNVRKRPVICGDWRAPRNSFILGPNPAETELAFH